jgi:lysophospholipase L1-like esterase
MTRRFPLRASAAALAVLTLLSVSGCAVWRARQSAELARQSEPFQASPPAPAGRLLIVGDSTAVGTGASSPNHSVAGLLASAHPRLAITNHGEDGARFEAIARQLERAQGRWDAVLVLGGGNDVIRLTGYEKLQDAVGRTAQLARERSDLVVFLPSGNVGNAPFFFPPLSWWMTQRSQTLHEIVRGAAAAHGASYVNLYKNRAADPFARDPKGMNAKDGLHPSDAGYRLWLEELNRQAGFSGKLPG